MKSKKPSKEVLEIDLRAGLPLLTIAKKHNSSVASVHNWIRSYELSYLKGIKEWKVEPVVTPTAKDIEKAWKPAEPIKDMVQESPTLAEIEQFHTDTEVQELPIVEMDLSDESNVSDSLSDEEYDRTMATVDVPSVPVVGIAEPEMNIYTCLDCGCKFVSFVYASVCHTCYESLGDHEPINAEPQQFSMGTCEEVLQGVLDDLRSVRRVYVMKAEEAFDERLSALFAERDASPWHGHVVLCRTGRSETREARPSHLVSA